MSPRPSVLIERRRGSAAAVAAAAVRAEVRPHTYPGGRCPRLLAQLRRPPLRRRESGRRRWPRYGPSSTGPRARARPTPPRRRGGGPRRKAAAPPVQGVPTRVKACAPPLGSGRTPLRVPRGAPRAPRPKGLLLLLPRRRRSRASCPRSSVPRSGGPSRPPGSPRPHQSPPPPAEQPPAEQPRRRRFPAPRWRRRRPLPGHPRLKGSQSRRPRPPPRPS